MTTSRPWSKVAVASQLKAQEAQEQGTVCNQPFARAIFLICQAVWPSQSRQVEPCLKLM